MTWLKCDQCHKDFEYNTGNQINCYLTQFETRCPNCDRRMRVP